MEHHVMEAYERLKTLVPGFVDTPAHKDDAVVYALNRLQPKYVVTSAGKAVTEVALDTAQHRAAIDVQMIEALQQVARIPRNPPSSAPPG